MKHCVSSAVVPIRHGASVAFMCCAADTERKRTKYTNNNVVYRVENHIRVQASGW